MAKSGESFVLGLRYLLTVLSVLTILPSHMAPFPLLGRLPHDRLFRRIRLLSRALRRGVRHHGKMSRYDNITL